MEVTVIRSAKRRRTAQASVVDGCLEVRIPARSTKADEARLVEQFRRRFERGAATAGTDLGVRARRLTKAHDLPRPTEIRWVGNQSQRWGSCTRATGVIRISDRLAVVPTWVLDLVIVHELAHLLERGHDARFAALVARYPLAERAEGYLLAMAGGTDPTTDPLADDVDGDEDGDDATGDDTDPGGGHHRGVARRSDGSDGASAPIALGPGSLPDPPPRSGSVARRPPPLGADGARMLPFPDLEPDDARGFGGSA